MNVWMNESPHYIRNEIIILQEHITPMMKIVSRYTFWSMPLISISILNIFIYITALGELKPLPVIIFAILGALGLALSKEARLKQLEVQKVSMDFVINRIQKSDRVSDVIKNKYIALIQEQPIKTITHFIKFLEDENK
ncbi:hypothetical protein FZW96_01090 [Bacillus sp. BGMRC 2118]|nr:hypothetical protein FZW96_01090 [Bacillus sp. BGMRC 2118]